MPQSLVQSLTNTFVKGLITEAGPLTFPKDASVDELNMVLNRDGSRRRRLGLDYEADYEESDFVPNATDIISVFRWDNVSGEGGKNYAVVQYGSNLVFYELDGNTISSNRVPTSNSNTTPYVIDLTAYEKPSTLGAENFSVDVTSLNGLLIVVSPEIEAISVDRNPTTGAFTVTQINFEERDFQWLGKEDSNYYEKLATASVDANRKYDTQNVGWVGDLGDAALVAYETHHTAWPPLTHPWYSGKNTSGNFSQAEFDKIYLGTSLAANGHFIYNIFEKDRATASGLVSLSTETTSARFSTVAGYAGRVFYSGLNSNRKGLGSKIYFSQLIIDNFEDIGRCYQRNDPTSEEFSDLLDTDGGFISIPEANNIRKLHVFGPSLYVFADNGVWQINGVDDVFRATEYSVSKLTEIGLKYKDTFVSAEGRPYWWSDIGIHTLALNDQIGSIIEQDISTSTIRTFWASLTETQKNRAIGVYDGLNSRVVWMYPNTESTTYRVRLKNFLVFDEVFTAFYPWSISGTNHIVGAVYDSNVSTSEENSSGLKFLIRRVETAKLTWGGFTNTNFEDLNETDYDSYAVAGYDFLGDLTIQKNAPYVTVFLNRTETGFTGSESLGYEPVRTSSCLLSAYWDFATEPSSTQQAYRLKFPIVPNPSDLNSFDYPTTVITTKLKVRGRGRSFRLKFEAEPNKDLHLYGFEVIGARNPTI